MSREYEFLQRIHRGRRIAEVRNALGIDGEQFAERLQQGMHARGFSSTRYDKAKLSRIEKGSRDVSIDEAVVILGLDPQRRDFLWLAGEGTAVLENHRQTKRRPAG